MQLTIVSNSSTIHDSVDIQSLFYAALSRSAGSKPPFLVRPHPVDVPRRFFATSRARASTLEGREQGPADRREVTLGATVEWPLSAGSLPDGWSLERKPRGLNLGS